MNMKTELRCGVQIVALEALFDLPDFEECVNAYEELGRKYIQTGFSKSAYLDIDPNQIIAIACIDDGRCAGFAGLIPKQDHHFGKIMMVDSIFVKREYRQLGYGARLFEKIREVSRAEKCKALLFSAMAGTALEKIYSKRYKKFCTVFYEEL